MANFGEIPSNISIAAGQTIRRNAGNTGYEAYTPGSGGAVDWGSVGGTLSDQTDLQTALDTKAATSHAHTIADISDLTATASELNALDGITATVAELNYVDGVTSAIQTQLNGKAATSHSHAISDVTNLQSGLDGKVDENDAITGATKTKITYDAKGLVTAGADATTADIAASTNKNYVTDAQLTVIGNTSGTNTGDQTTIVGITGTKAQFDTAVTDGNFLYVGDITQYTDELAQDAVGAMVDSTIVYTDGTPLLSRAALTGAITASAGSNATALGSFTKAQLDGAVSDGNVLYVGDVTTNATHTGEVTGSGALTVDKTAITGKAEVTAVGTDYVLISDTSDSGNLKKALASDLAGGGGASTSLNNLASVAINTSLLLGNSDAGALGSGAKMWSDLFLADGSVINFNNGDVTMTHSGETITVAGGNLAVPDDAYAAGWNGSVHVPTKNAIYDKVETLAPLASPTFTGTPAAPTAAAGTNTTQLATTAFVTATNNNAVYRTILDVAGSHIAGRTANTYGFGYGDPLAITGTGTLYPLAVIRIDSADYPTINGIAADMRVKVTLFVNDVAPTGNFTFGLHPVTRPATSGGAGLLIYTIGAAVAGSTVAINTPAADTMNTAASADFAVPADGYYVLGVVTTQTVAASSHLHMTAKLQMRNS